jgi:hypothetical protein
MTRRLHLLILITGCCLLPAILTSTSTARDLQQVLQQEYISGDIDYKTLLLRQFYMMYAPEKLLTLYPQDRQETPVKCGTVLLMALENSRHLFTPAEQAGIDGLLKSTARSPTQFQLIIGSGKFKLHYDKTNADHKVPPENIDGYPHVQKFPDHPDWVVIAYHILDSVLAVYTDEMGYLGLPDDEGKDGEQFDVYFHNLRGQNYGQTAFGLGNVHITVDNDFADNGFYTNGIDGLRVTLAHELYHALQFRYALPSGNEYFFESSATFMEEYFYPEVKDFYQYLPSFFNGIMTTPFNTDPAVFYSYGLVLYNIYLEQRFPNFPNNNPMLRQVWEHYGNSVNRRMHASLDHVLQQKNFSFAESLAEFHEWNYYTDQRANPQVSYKDGADYYIRHHNGQRNESYVTTIIPDTQIVFATESITINVPRATPHYLRIVTRNPENYTLRAETGDLNDYDLTWDVRVLQDDATQSNYSKFPDQKTQYEALWDLDYLGPAPKFTILATVTDPDKNMVAGSGDNFPLTLHISTGDTELITDNRLDAPFPNPFLADGMSAATIEYFLAKDSDVEIFIVSSTGREIWSEDLGHQFTGANSTTWDGYDQDGKPAPSGVYICMLKTSAGREMQKMAVIRR